MRMAPRTWLRLVFIGSPSRDSAGNPSPEVRRRRDTIPATPPDAPILPASWLTSPYNRPSFFFGIVPAAMSEPPKPAFEFGPFSLDPGKRLLLRNGEAVPLAPKVLETLLALVENRDRVLSKDELLDQVWGGASVEEGGLTRNVSILRKTLGEKPDDHRFIVTVPGHGYRFVAAVKETTVNEPPAEVRGGPTRQNGRPSRPLARRWLALAGLAVLALASTVYMVRPVATPVRPPITSLAVLPLNNLSGDPTQDYFADGMTEALIGNLAPISALRVVSRTSVMRFKGTRTSLPEIARELKVDGVIEGSVQRTRDRVRISVQLIHAPTDTHLWAREYERELTDVLKLQGEVARAVADEIRIQVTAEERARMASAGTVDPAAHQEYLLGQHYLWKLTEEDLARAIEHFERATRSMPPTPRHMPGCPTPGGGEACGVRKRSRKSSRHHEPPRERLWPSIPDLLKPTCRWAASSSVMTGTGQGPKMTSVARWTSTRTISMRTFFPRCCSWRWAASPSRSLTSREPSNSIRCRRRFIQRSAGSCIVPASSTRQFLI